MYAPMTSRQGLAHLIPPVSKTTAGTEEAYIDAGPKGKVSDYSL